MPQWHSTTIWLLPPPAVTPSCMGSHSQIHWSSPWCPCPVSGPHHSAAGLGPPDWSHRSQCLSKKIHPSLCKCPFSYFFDHATPLLENLQWKHILYHTRVKVLCNIFIIFHSLTPTYLSGLIPSQSRRYFPSPVHAEGSSHSSCAFCLLLFLSLPLSPAELISSRDCSFWGGGLELKPRYPDSHYLLPIIIHLIFFPICLLTALSCLIFKTLCFSLWGWKH